MPNNQAIAPEQVYGPFSIRNPGDNQLFFEFVPALTLDASYVNIGNLAAAKKIAAFSVAATSVRIGATFAASTLECVFGASFALRDQNGNQVVCVQQGFVNNATDAASVILRLNELLVALRTHGLIASP